MNNLRVLTRVMIFLLVFLVFAWALKASALETIALAAFMSWAVDGLWK